ncbi:S9 family peptidase [Paenibacillus albus]|uniref:S9 family peptidase n=1 Tax=Paenibacillus albus TaxID=2495582 RepID=UPI002ACB0ED3|nr:S9 family peptidase [Paenibacillus albus]
MEDFTFSPDETQLVFSTNITGKYNLWAMDMPNRFPYQIAFADESCSGLQYDEQGRYVLVGYDKDGNENTQLYAIPPRGGHLQPLRATPGERHLFIALSKDGERLYYNSTKGNSTYWNSYCYHLQTDQEQTLTSGSDAVTALVQVSHSETSFAYVKVYSNTYQLLYIRVGNEDLLVTPKTDEEHAVTAAVYTTEDEIYLLTNYDSDYSYLASFNLKTKVFSKVCSLEHVDMSALEYDKLRKRLYIVGSKGVENFIYCYRESELSHISAPVSIISKLSVSKQGNLYILGERATRPKNVFKKTIDGDWEELTFLRVPCVEEEQLIEPEVVSYQSFDGTAIEALYYQAKSDVDNEHLIVWPHGGPQHADRKTFRPLFQFLLNRGYSIFSPNFRGSTGYGQQFKKMVEGDWGHGPRQDILSGIEWMIEQGNAKADKLFIMGGSYGGYMSLLMIGRHPGYFKACVDMFGPSSLFTLIDSSPDYWKPMMARWIGDPIRDKVKLTEDSPINYVDDMVTPLFVVQGANDPRVTRGESDQIVKALETKGVKVDYVLMENEGHGFSKKENELYVYRRIVDFFNAFI